MSDTLCGLKAVTECDQMYRREDQLRRERGNLWLMLVVYHVMLCDNLTDIDECREGIAWCSHECHNTNGSYSCTCPYGYRLEAKRMCVGMFFGHLRRQLSFCLLAAYGTVMSVLSEFGLVGLFAVSLCCESSSTWICLVLY